MAISTRLSPGKLYASLNPSGVPYLEFFRVRVIGQLTRQPDGPATFWSRTLLQESMVDENVVDAIVGIGALSRAQLDGQCYKPSHLPQLGSHYLIAIHHYTRAVAAFRRRLDALRDRPISPRTLLILTILFSTFEILHGNTSALDILASNGLELFSKRFASTDGKSRKPAAPRTVDEIELHDAACFLSRTTTWSAIFSPMYPRSRQVMAQAPVACRVGARPPNMQTAASVADYWRAWWQFITTSVAWHLSSRNIQPEESGDHFPSCRLTTERQELLDRTSLWLKETEERLVTATVDGSERNMLTMLVFEIKVAYWAAYHALDEGEGSWESCEEDLLAFLAMAERTITELTLTGYEAIMSDGLLIGLLHVSKECRSYFVRWKALGLSRLLIARNSSWHVKSLVMGIYACVLAEEECRDVISGGIALANRYEWTGGFWNNDFTKLHATLTKKVEDEHGVRLGRLLIVSTDILKVT